MKRECENCAYFCDWHETKYTDLGTCTRFPPVASHEDKPARFPLVSFACVCGEFKLRGQYLQNGEFAVQGRRS